MPLERRQYGLFEQQGGKWIRLLPTLSFKKTAAVRLFQDQLLAPFVYGIDGEKVKGVRRLQPVVT